MKVVLSILFIVLCSFCVIDAHNHHVRGLVVDENANDMAKQLTQDIEFAGKNGERIKGVRCATPRGKPDERSIFDDRRDLQQCFPSEGITIKTVFHKIYSSTDNSIGDNLIYEQMRVLNDAFSSHGFQFSLSEIVSHLNDSHFTGCATDSIELEMKNTYARDPTNYLNIYSCSPSGGLLGYATFPFMYSEDNKLHGVVILDQSVPGGTAVPYHLGDTLVHEVGHYLGLYHTFQSWGPPCRGPGDYVDDTPLQQSPTYGCPADRDSCSRSPGLDPIHNYMDYSDDVCMYEFTSDQVTRMKSEVCTYKPLLVQNSQSGTSPTVADTPPPVGSSSPTTSPSGTPTLSPTVSKTPSVSPVTPQPVSCDFQDAKQCKDAGCNWSGKDKICTSP